MKIITNLLVPAMLIINISCEDTTSENSERSEVIQENSDGTTDSISTDNIADEEIIAEHSYWTGWFSDEGDAQGVCSKTPIHVVRGIDCKGRYCDSLNLRCVNLPKNEDGSTVKWTEWLSEENAELGWSCHGIFGPNYWLYGIKCKGNKCDNLSLGCIKTSYIGIDCRESDWYSEEQDEFIAPSGYAIHGVACKGSYCDNKQYSYCFMTKLAD